MYNYSFAQKIKIIPQSTSGDLKVECKANDYQ